METDSYAFTFFFFREEAFLDTGCQSEFSGVLHFWSTLLFFVRGQDGATQIPGQVL